MKNFSLYVTHIVIVLVLFAGIFATFYGVSQFFFQQYVDNVLVLNTREEQSKVDKSIRSTYYELLSYNNRELFSASNIITLKSDPTQFSTIYTTSVPNTNLLHGAFIITDTGTYFSGPDVDFVSNRDRLDGLINPDNTLKFVNIDQKNGIDVLIFSCPITIAESIGVCFYIIDLNYCVGVARNIGGDFGYSAIFMQKDSTRAQLIYHENKNYIGDIVQLASVSSKSNELSRREVVDEVDSILISNVLNETNSAFNLEWGIITYIDATYVYEEINQVYLTLNIFGIIAMISLLVLIIVQLSLTLRPLKRLSNKVKSYDDINSESTAKVVAPRNEIALLETTYDDMVKRISVLKDQLIEDMEAQRKLELDSLQIQINPHFLYNVLDAIAWMAKIEDEREIERIVIALAKFYRLSLHKGAKFIAVEEELEIIRHFFEIELFRYPNKFTYIFEMSEEVKDKLTLKLILQPFVENSIKHGLLTLKNQGTIRMSAKLDSENYIVFEIDDDGVGFDELANKDKYDEKSLSGYGIANVNERLRLQYKDNYSLKITSKINQGTKVVIRIPSKDLID